MKGALVVQTVIWVLARSVRGECPSIKPFECSDRTCVEDYSECRPFPGCLKPTRPFLCSNGQCALNHTECKEKFFQCEDHTLTKCIDGICRDDCSQIRHSSCPFNLGYRCPDGKCVKQIIECGCECNQRSAAPTRGPFGARTRSACPTTPPASSRSRCAHWKRFRSRSVD